jgi:F-type H+-transporting ATPase subunit gamma
MARINEIKEQQSVVTTVGTFANSLQQIAAMRMVKLRKIVFSSRRFVDEATLILRELHLERSKSIERELGHQKKSPGTASSSLMDDPLSLEGIKRKAIIVMTSDIGLCGSYNTEIIKKLEEIMPQHPDADYFVIGHKGQNYMSRVSDKYNVKYYPYNVPEEVSIVDLKPLIGMFYYYTNIYLIYSRFVNTATREVVFMELSVPNIEEVEIKKEKEEGKYIFEPSIDDLISSVSARVRYALFRQQILDSKLSLYTAQMIAMKTAADNAQELLGDLQLEYNKARRKNVDRKILEVQAGRSLWADEV